ncbi:MAG: class I SAM-dependent methyltransferase [Acidobacteriia bacterium]|nr:class I SAM-dependent methyltransferase [Terriglobia bacterium]
MNRPFAPRPCPVCGSRQSTAIFRQSFAAIGGAQLLEGYDVAICSRCGAGFADGIPEQAVFDEYYRDLSKYESFDSNLGQAPPMEPRAYDLAATIGRFIPAPDSRVLEIGSGSGQLLKVLRDGGFRNVLASDPSPGCVRSTERLYGIPGVAGSIFTLSEPGGFDFLILIGVLEHIRDLDGAVSRLHALLREGGRVYIEVPDASRYDASADAPFQEFSVEHVNFFSPASLSALIESRGFAALAVERVERRRNQIVCRNIWGVFVKASEASGAAAVHDAETETGLRAYIEACRAEDDKIRARIEQSLPPDGRMAVWGAGAHTLRLLAAGGLDPARIDVFVDSNPKYQGKRLSGVAVESPAALKRYDGPVLISSRGFQGEIVRSAREQYGLTNRFILLYEAAQPL